MSANIYWRPTAASKKDLPVDLPSSFIEAMERAFGHQHRWILSQDSLPILRGMAAAWSVQTSAENPFDRLVQLVERGEIEVWAEY